jgi:photosystem II stability/assembly factor-like uncharacterized protein
MNAAIFAGSAQWVAASADSRVVGLFRKNCAADDWRQLHSGLPAHVEVRALAIHPQDTGTILAATQVGPYRSTDSGDTWTAMNFPLEAVCWSILYAPNDPRTIYCGTVEMGVFCSHDEGRSWTEFSIAEPQGLCKMGFPTRVIALAADPSSPQLLYAALEVGGLVRSIDAGATWQDCNAPLMGFAAHARYKSQLFSDTDTEGMLDSHALAVSAARSGEVLLANRMGLFRSADGGLSWADIDVGQFSPLTYARDIIVSPHDPHTLYAALSKAAVSDEGSLYRSHDLGESWQRFDHGVEIRSTLMTIAASRSSAERVYCAARRGQVFGTEDGGASWQEHPLPRGVEGVYAIAC